MNKELFLLIFIVIILSINPRVLKIGANTIFGKLILLIILVGATIYNTVYGVLIAIIFVSLITFDKPLYEGYSQSTNPFSTSGTYSTRLVSNDGDKWPQLGPGDYIESPNKLYRFGIKKDAPYGAILMDVSGTEYWLQGFPNSEISGIGIAGTTSTTVHNPTPEGYENYKGSLVFTDEDSDVLLWTPCDNLAEPNKIICNGDAHAPKGNFLFLNDDGSLVLSNDASQNSIIWMFGPDQVTPYLFTKDNVNPAVANQFWKQQTIGSGDGAASVWERMNKFGGCGDWRVSGCQDDMGIHNIRYRLDLKNLYDSGLGKWGPPKAQFNATDSWNELKDQTTSKISFQQQHCRKSLDPNKSVLDFVDSTGKVLTSDKITNQKFIALDNNTSYTVNFTEDNCNPCDPDCKYTVTQSDERITGEEKLRGKDSSMQLPSMGTYDSAMGPGSIRASGGYVADTGSSGGGITGDLKDIGEADADFSTPESVGKNIGWDASPIEKGTAVGSGGRLSDAVWRKRW